MALKRGRIGTRVRAGLWTVAVTVALVAPALVLLPSASAVRAPSATKSGCGYLKLPTPICHVFIIFLENQNLWYVLKNGPFEKYLTVKYASDGNFYSLQHFSYPNYAAATSGQQLKTFHLVDRPNVIDLIRNRTPTPTWAGYAEDMPHPCDWNASTGYKPAHNPLVWYTTVRHPAARCIAHDLNFTSWNSSVANNTLPNYAFIAPNATHSCWMRGFGVKICDPWLKGWLSPLINDSFFNSSVFFITYDEGQFKSLLGANGTVGGGHVYFSAVSPYSCPGYVSYYNDTAFNLLTTTEWLLGLGQLGQNDSWQTHPPMRGLFCFPTNSTGGGGGIAHLGGLAGAVGAGSPAASRRSEDSATP